MKRVQSFCEPVLIRRYTPGHSFDAWSIVSNFEVKSMIRVFLFSTVAYHFSELVQSTFTTTHFLSSNFITQRKSDERIAEKTIFSIFLVHLMCTGINMFSNFINCRTVEVCPIPFLKSADKS